MIKFRKKFVPNIIIFIFCHSIFQAVWIVPSLGRAPGNAACWSSVMMAPRRWSCPHRLSQRGESHQEDSSRSQVRILATKLQKRTDNFGKIKAKIKNRDGSTANRGKRKRKKIFPKPCPAALLKLPPKTTTFNPATRKKDKKPMLFLLPAWPRPTSPVMK